MGRMFRHYFTSAATLTALLTPGWAQAQAATESETADAAPVIVVTAQKREQAIQDVPASISVVTAETIEQRGIDNAESLQFDVPSMQVGRMPVLGGTAISIRGVGLNEGSPGVAVHADGVYQTRPSFADLAQLDLARVEVLRGPQGTLYGRNANGGVVNFITRQPGSRFGGHVLAGYAEYQEWHLQAAVDVPLGKSIRTRFLVDYADRDDGFVKHIGDGQDLDAHETLSGRAAISFDLSPDLTIDLTAAASHSEGPVSYLQLNSPPSAGAIALNPFLANATFALKPWTTSANDPSTSDRDYALFTGTLNWDLGPVEFRSISGYQTFDDFFQTDSDGSDLSIFPQTDNTDSKTFTQEFNLSGRSKALEWVAGLYYLNDKGSRDVFFDFQQGFGLLPPGGYLSLDNPDRDSRVIALFGDLTWNVTDRLRLIAGARQSWKKQRYVYVNELGIQFMGQRIPILPLCPLREDTPKFKSFTPRGGVQYDMDDDRNVYAIISKGFKAGGVNTDSCNDEFQPEKLTSYEAGFRGQWLDRRLTFNASAFYYDYSDLQISQVVGFGKEITNAAAAKVYGVEVVGCPQTGSGWRPMRPGSMPLILNTKAWIR